MLRRKVYGRLMEWKSRPHKPLVLKGPRQVGKTYIVRYFASKNYKSEYYIDFSKDSDARDAFDGNLDVDTIVTKLKLNRSMAPIHPGKTLIVMDEVQDCPNAYQALKSFSEDGRYDVVATGSLLGLDNATLRTAGISPRDRPPLTPIGQVEHVILRSLDFEEFLWATGLEEDTMELIKSSIRDRKELDPVMLRAMEARYRDYLIVGGMPDPVNAFVASRDFSAVAMEQDTILVEIVNDITRYNKDSDAEKIRNVMRSIPGQLSMDNKKFTYSRLGDIIEEDEEEEEVDEVKEEKGDAEAEEKGEEEKGDAESDEGTGKTHKEYAEKYAWALTWIRNAGYGNFCYNVKSPEHPLELRTKEDDFKVYLTDTGILIRMIGPEAARAVYYGDYSYNIGAIAENAVAEGILKSGMPVRYYRKTTNEDRMEVDFVLENGSDMVAVEVKSGKTRKSPSLAKAARVFHLDRRIMFGQTNIFVDDKGVEHYPLFASAFMREILPPGKVDFGSFPDYLRRGQRPFKTHPIPALLIY